jgi:hypothetical protein
MRPCDFITFLGSNAAVTWPFAACAQQGHGARRIDALLGLAKGDPAAGKYCSRTVKLRTILLIACACFGRLRIWLLTSA